MNYKHIILLVFFLVVSCKYFKKADNRNAIARVNDVYLYKDDIVDLIEEGTSKTDSALIVQNFINKWATQQLLLDGAFQNLSESKQEDFNALVEQYRTDLFTKAYIDALVQKNMDTIVNHEEAKVYYNQNKNIFILNERLIKFRYIYLDKKINNFGAIERKFQRFNKKDRKELNAISIQFKSYSLNDSTWIRAKQVIQKIPMITTSNEDELLKKSNYIQLKDSIGVYLIKINDVKLRNQTAPLEYVKPTIDQIVINKRKLELIRKLETDITKDAIKNNQFEIYN